VYEAQRTAHPQIYVQQLTGSDAIPLTQEPASNSEPTVSPDGETIAFVSNRDGSDEIWLMSRDGTNQHVFTKSPQIRESAPHFLRDGSLTYLVEGKDGGRTLSQVVKADLATGRVAPATGTELAVSSFTISPGGELLALVVNAQPGGKPVYRVYLAPAGQPAVPIPTTGTEQMVTPALLP
jgi:Tol biopolymer transport system component